MWIVITILLSVYSFKKKQWLFHVSLHLLILNLIYGCSNLEKQTFLENKVIFIVYFIVVKTIMVVLFVQMKFLMHVKLWIGLILMYSIGQSCSAVFWITTISDP